MKIGVMQLNVQKDAEPKEKYYNSQLLGLAKALTLYCEEVAVYKLVGKTFEFSVETLSEYGNLILYRIPVSSIGTNALPNLTLLDKDIDLLILFSDIQIAVPQVYKWAKVNNIELMAYIGVLESHSEHWYKRLIMEVLKKRVIQVYKRCTCLAKTPDIEKRLVAYGCKDVYTFPVGLDKSLLKKDYAKYDVNMLKEEKGYTSNEKIILFVGRLCDEKRPLEAIELFEQLYCKNENYRLLMIGKGDAQKKVLEKIQVLNLEEVVRVVDSVENKDMWEYYRIAECFVNLNRNEIFGMAILEAMYYECKVIAWEAPGPSFIIKDKEDGFLVKSKEEFLERITSETLKKETIHNKIKSYFLWEVIVEKMLKSELEKRKGTRHD